MAFSIAVDMATEDEIFYAWIIFIGAGADL